MRILIVSSLVLVPMDFTGIVHLNHNSSVPEEMFYYENGESLGVWEQKISQYHYSEDEDEDLTLSEKEKNPFNGIMISSDHWLRIETFRLGKLHSFDDLPAMFEMSGATQDYRKFWYQNGVQHRDKGFATDWNASPDPFQAWYQKGRLHRSDGPAYIDPYTEEHWIDGKKISERELF